MTIRVSRVALTAFAILGLTLSGGASAQQADEATLRLANEVRKRIVTLSNYGVFDNVTFGIQGSTVVLRGQASRPSLKKSAERVVRNLEQVEEVVNEIEASPTSGMDENIRVAVYARVYGHPALSIYNPNRGVPMYGVRRRIQLGISNDPPSGPHPIHIIVKNGRVTLEGVVNRESDKNIAGIQANSVSGVFSVSNNIMALRPDKKKKKKG